MCTWRGDQWPQLIDLGGRTPPPLWQWKWSLRPPANLHPREASGVKPCSAAAADLTRAQTASLGGQKETSFTRRVAQSWGGYLGRDGSLSLEVLLPRGFQTELRKAVAALLYPLWHVHFEQQVGPESPSQHTFGTVSLKNHPELRGRL